MIASIVVYGGPDGDGKATRGTILAAPCAAASAFLNFIHRERFGAIFAHIVVPVMRTVRAYTVTARSALAGGTLNHDTKSVRTLFSGFARVQLRQKSPRCIADRFHLPSSLIAPASELHGITKERPGSWISHPQTRRAVSKCLM